VCGEGVSQADVLQNLQIVLAYLRGRVLLLADVLHNLHVGNLVHMFVAVRSGDLAVLDDLVSVLELLRS
jgi:hypothetical protein